MPDPLYINRPNYLIEVVDDVISVRVPFNYKDTLKAIHGAKFNFELRLWQYPRSVETARSINSVISSTVPRSISFREMLKREVDSEIIRVSEELPPVPITVLPAWNHQKQAFWFAKNKQSVMLAMDMGTGKTKVSIDILQNDNAEKVLIACPSHVIHVWPNEFKKHCVDYDNWEIVLLNTGSTVRNSKLLRSAIEISRAKGKKLLVVVNYEAIWRPELAKIILSNFWDFIIADESHRIKAPQGTASKFMVRLKIVSRRRLALTGTPMPHTPMDIYAQYRFLDDKVFGTSFTRFKRRYGHWGGFGGYQLIGFQNEVELNQRFYSIAYKVGKEVLDLPPIMPPIVIPVVLEPAARKVYNSLREDFLVALEEDKGIVTVNNSLTKLLRLQQVTSGYLPSPETKEEIEVSGAKERALQDVLTDLSSTEPVVVFCRFRRDLDTVHRVAKSLFRKSCELSGRVNSLELWKKSDSMPILAVQIQAGGVGIDLTKARYCVYYSLGYSLGDYEQSLARVHRPGQAYPVQYIHLICQRTVDQAVYQALEDKKEVVTEILRNMRTSSTEEEIEYTDQDEEHVDG